MSGFGGGSFIWNQIQTALINPHNVGTNSSATDGEDEYFICQLILGQSDATHAKTGAIYESQIIVVN